MPVVVMGVILCLFQAGPVSFMLSTHVRMRLSTPDNVIRCVKIMLGYLELKMILGAVSVGLIWLFVMVCCINVRVLTGCDMRWNTFRTSSRLVDVFSSVFSPRMFIRLMQRIVAMVFGGQTKAW